VKWRIEIQIMLLMRQVFQHTPCVDLPAREQRKFCAQSPLSRTKLAAPSPILNAAARRITEIANTVEPAKGKIYIELINYPMLFNEGALPVEY
jgi:hypothetical protein